MSRGSKRKEPAAPLPGRPETATLVGAAALAAALAASALLVDPGAEAAFDAPKRLAAMLAIALAAAAVFLAGGRGESPARLWRLAGKLPRAAAILWVAALGGAAAAALLSPRRDASLDALRALLVYALLVPLGASRLFPRFGRPLLALFLALSAFNGAVSLLQWRGVFRPFALAGAAAREITGAFAGNVGYLALAMALAAVAGLAIVLEARRPGVRAAAAAATALFVADLVVNQNLTSLTAVAAGSAAFVAARRGRRTILPAVAVIAALLVGVAVFRPARARAREAVRAARAGDWDRLLTYRLGPWAAAVEMVKERPLLGYGPGSFAAEFVPHRLKAEIGARRRFVNPLVTSGYGEAHSEPLQAVAEGGLAGLAAIGAAGALLFALWRAARAADSGEAALLLGVLVAGAVAALTWFPLQRPITAIPLLLAAGRAWRLAAERPAGDRP
jgi:O-antigen ligase